MQEGTLAHENTDERQKRLRSNVSNATINLLCWCCVEDTEDAHARNGLHRRRSSVEIES